MERNVVYLDEPNSAHVAAQAEEHVVVFTSAYPYELPRSMHYSLARWTRDEWIEYLLATHPEQCQRIMSCVGHTEDRLSLHGVPLLCRIVMDEMAKDESIVNAREALRRHWRSCCPSQHTEVAAQSYAFAAITVSESFAESHCERVADRHLQALLHHRIMGVFLAADRVLSRLANGDDSLLRTLLPRDLVAEIAAVVRTDAACIEVLEAVVAGENCDPHAMAVSILHATGGWKARRIAFRNLANAYLDGIQWPGADLSETKLGAATFRAADLTGANLARALAAETSFASATLRRCVLDKISAPNAGFANADLTDAHAPEADFQHASFAGANLRRAVLTRANLMGADLSAARFHEADLRGARLPNSVIAGADFSDANLTAAQLHSLKLQDAVWDGACLVAAGLVNADLEGIELPGANLEKAILFGANLTGASMPRASLWQADLRDTRLADVNWEDANLREADFTGATFHMGSSRSGLVNSPIASEGTRTGFYTDDYDQQHFKSPEEIRKANLCGADLRGALVLDTDFYLVDLRRAVYTRDQREHFVRCGAILVDRA
jgi:uncharacterized protein YjbI with pentapeptide repeats